MTTNTALDMTSPVLVAGTADACMEIGQRDALLADATAHLLFAYEAIDEFSQIDPSSGPHGVCEHLSISLRHADRDRRVLRIDMGQ